MDSDVTAAAVRPGENHMRYALPALIQLALLVYTLIQCIQTDSMLVRNLPKPLWVVLIIIVPVVGPIAWLVAGRPESSTRATGQVRPPWPSTRTAGFPEYERPRAPLGPDDDPSFLAGLNGPDKEKEELLRQWEEQLRHREQEMKGTDDDATSRGDEPPSDPAKP